ncbi:hypothetical protein KSP40_PGU018686 [Platanthera guangdongensis]|uniref:ATP synthase F0 subunit 8 n=1 Tax=Platanthera guangdongensis TaxID=2320717 RepID=A0ABR2MNG7_9ASPA
MWIFFSLFAILELTILFLRCSSFNHHFGHVLAKKEDEKLKKQKLKFKWNMPAKEMPMSTLVGTGNDLYTVLYFYSFSLPLL